MNRMTIVVAVGLALAGALPAIPAAAQASRTFVSGHGNDANNCSLTAPCRSFAAAFALTNASGEIDVLDTAGYGALTINKAISIVNDGSIASVLVPTGGNGITINAGANDAVSLRGLTIEGAGTGATGIQFNTGAALTIENCVIRHVNDNGVSFNPTASSDLVIANSIMSDNGLGGIEVNPTGSGTFTAVFDHVQVTNNGNHGINVVGSNSTGTVNATATNSLISRNGFVGATSISATAAAPATLMLFKSVVANNASIGVEAIGTGAILRMGQTVVTGHPNGWQTFNSGAVQSYGDNDIDGNTLNQGLPSSVSHK